ncbi:MAG: NAD(P)-binding domain-containing protein [Bacteroidetes bacterium]|jgi:pyrroline-5-carboxylate reductase|nr:NAD(P)-binding domain-containing protein [Bacteroidota bacterium]MBT4400046.1 NAD(P)-binding domain-containing protein [Bacteroidota bacterium]MBT4410400.1 NAD(P)-binding domain-containing protein [Bacteroidota bacterium]MBT7094586.1 NAD(P)-binding domain-containing protein [Bacteroidota bacterium]MBT7462697.1 NAD(P)-binding domain-containing protein [Bacteroidota bacterium]
MKTKSLGFIGGGRVTRILLQAFANKTTKFHSIIVYDINPDVLAALCKQFPDIELAETPAQAAWQSIVIIALHPPVIMECLNKIVDSITTDSVVVSLAPKITIEKIATKLKTANIARMIPNATSFINEGYNPITFASNFLESERANLLDVLDVLGHNFETVESKLEAYAMISAMLPTYFWFQWNELEKLGTQMGLTDMESRRSIRDTMAAAINLMYDSELEPEQVKDLIPVKPIGDSEAQILELYQTKLLGLFRKITP